MKKVKRTIAILLVVVLVFSLMACGNEKSNVANEKANNSENKIETETTENNSEKKVVALLTWSLAEEFHVDVLKGAENAAKNLGIEVVSPDPAGDMQKEISIIEDLIQQKVDGIIIAPVDAQAIVPYIDKIREADIKVVVYDIDTDAEVDAKVLANNVDGGEVSGEYLMERMGGKGKILILEEVPGVTTAEERIEGFKKAAEKYPDIELVSQLSNGTRDTHRATTENMLTAHPDIGGIFCFMGDNTLGAYAACQAMSRTDVLIAGYDATPEQIDIMKNDGADSNLISSLALYPKIFGKTAIETMDKVLKGETVEEVVYTEQELILAKDAENFQEKE